MSRWVPETRQRKVEGTHLVVLTEPFLKGIITLFLEQGMEKGLYLWYIYR